MWAIDAIKAPWEKVGPGAAGSTIRIWKMEDMSLGQSIWIGACQILSAVYRATIHRASTGRRTRPTYADIPPEFVLPVDGAIETRSPGYTADRIWQAPNPDRLSKLISPFSRWDRAARRAGPHFFPGSFDRVDRPHHDAANQQGSAHHVEAFKILPNQLGHEIRGELRSQQRQWL